MTGLILECRLAGLALDLQRLSARASLLGPDGWARAEAAGAGQRLKALEADIKGLERILGEGRG